MMAATPDIDALARNIRKVRSRLFNEKTITLILERGGYLMREGEKERQTDRQTETDRQRQTDRSKCAQILTSACSLVLTMF